MLLFSSIKLLTYTHISPNNLVLFPFMSWGIYIRNDNIIILCGALLMCHILLLS